MKKLDEKQKAWLYSGVFLLLIAMLLLLGAFWMFYELGKPKRPIEYTDNESTEPPVHPSRKFMTEAEKRARPFSKLHPAATPWDAAGTPGHTELQPPSPYLADRAHRLKTPSIPWQRDLAEPTPLNLPLGKTPWSPIPHLDSPQPHRSFVALLPAANPWPSDSADPLAVSIPPASLSWSLTPRTVESPTLRSTLPWPDQLTIQPANSSASASLPWTDAPRPPSPAVITGQLPWPDQLTLRLAPTTSLASLPWPSTLPAHSPSLVLIQSPWPTELPLKPTLLASATLPWLDNPPPPSPSLDTPILPWPSNLTLQPTTLDPTPLPWNNSSQPVTTIAAQLPWTTPDATPPTLPRRFPDAQLPWTADASAPRESQRDFTLATLPFTDVDTPLNPKFTPKISQKNRTP